MLAGTDTEQTGPGRGGGGKYLIVQPGSDIREMRGYIVARSPSNQAWFAARALGRDAKVADEVVCKHRSTDGVGATTRRDQVHPRRGKTWGL